MSRVGRVYGVSGVGEFRLGNWMVGWVAGWLGGWFDFGLSLNLSLLVCGVKVTLGVNESVCFMFS